MGALGHYDEAIQDFTVAIRLGYAEGWVYRNRGGAYYCRGDSDRALADLGRAIGLDPHDAAAYRGRAAIYFERGQSAETLADLNEAVRLEPKNAEFLDTRGVHFERGDVSRAMADLDAAVRLDPKAPGPHVRHRFLHIRNQDWQLALTQFDTALRLDPTSGESHAYRAQVYSQLGDWDKALADCEAAFRLGDYRACGAGAGTAAEGRCPGALADCDEALRRFPNWPLVRQIQAVALETRRQNANSAPGLPPLPPSDLTWSFFTGWNLAAMVAPTPARSAQARAPHRVGADALGDAEGRSSRLRRQGGVRRRRRLPSATISKAGSASMPATSTKPFSPSIGRSGSTPRIRSPT